MISDSEIKKKGINVLIRELGEVEAERFITLLVREPFDYTEWQKDLWEDLSIEELSKKAMNFVQRKAK